MLSQIKYEGHPLTWFLLNFPIAKMGLPFDSMRILHGIVVIACFFIICFCMKCHSLLKLALLLGTVLSSELSIYSRNYAIGILLLLLLTIWYDKRLTSRKFHCSICLLLLANTNIYAAVVPIALFCCELLQALYTLIFEKKSPYEGEKQLGAIIFYSGIIVGITVLFLTLGTNLFAPFNRYVVNSTSFIGSHQPISLYAVCLRYIYYFGIATFGNGWPAYFLVCPLLLLLLYGSIDWLSQSAKSRLYTATLLISGTVGICVLIFLAKGVFYLRHAAILPFSLTFIWYTKANGNRHPYFVKLILVFIAVFAIINGTVSNYRIIQSSIHSVRSLQQRVASFIKNNGYDRDDVLIIGEDVLCNPVVIAYLDNVRKRQNHPKITLPYRLCKNQEQNAEANAPERPNYCECPNWARF